MNWMNADCEIRKHATRRFENSCSDGCAEHVLTFLPCISFSVSDNLSSIRRPLHLRFLYPSSRVLACSQRHEITPECSQVTASASLGIPAACIQATRTAKTTSRRRYVSSFLLCFSLTLMLCHLCTEIPKDENALNITSSGEADIVAAVRLTTARILASSDT